MNLNKLLNPHGMVRMEGEPGGGNPAGDPPAGDPPAGNPPAGNPPAAPWFGEVSPEIKGLIEKKGWDSAGSLAESYVNLEKLMGASPDQIIKMPAADDAEGMAKLFDRLGRPASADEYQLPVPDGQSDAFAKAAAAKMHELGLNVNQAQELAKFNNDFLATAMAEQEEAVKTAQAEAQVELNKKWGAALEKNTAIVDAAAAEFGMTTDQLVALREAMGPAGAMEFLYNIGSKLGEDSFVQGDNRPGFGAMSPDAARSEINSLKSDEGFRKKLLNNDHEAQSRWNKLHEWAYPPEQ